MASEVSIANRALQMLGQSSISSLTESGKSARECSTCYAELRDAELRAHTWHFAKQQFQLAADTTDPLFDFDNAFQLPTNPRCLRVLKPADRHVDWEIQGTKLFTNDDAPLDITCVVQVTDANTMDPLFREMLAAKMADAMCEALTQSNAKKADAREYYKQALREARRVNALERTPQEAAEDPWLTARR